MSKLRLGLITCISLSGLAYQKYIEYSYVPRIETVYFTGQSLNNELPKIFNCEVVLVQNASEVPDGGIYIAPNNLGISQILLLNREGRITVVAGDDIVSQLSQIQNQNQ